MMELLIRCDDPQFRLVDNGLGFFVQHGVGVMQHVSSRGALSGTMDGWTVVSRRDRDMRVRSFENRRWNHARERTAKEIALS